MQPAGAIALSLGAATLFSSLSTDALSAAPRRGQNNQTTATGTPSATKTSRPAATPGSRDIRLLEGALARTLTDAEKAAITAAATTRDVALKAAATSFETQVAALFSLSVAELQAKINSCRPSRGSALSDVLAQALGRALTADETIALNGAIATRDAAIMVAVDAYRTAVAAAVGLTLAQLDAKVSAYVAANNSGGHGSGGRPGGKRR